MGKQIFFFNWRENEIQQCTGYENPKQHIINVFRED